jgi:hypothetical protein
VLNYLGRYVHRIAITNNRILDIDNDQVTFAYQDTADQHWKQMSLKAEEFIRRFLQHVLPQSFHKVRYYGLWSPAYRPLLRRLQLLLAAPEHSCPSPALPASPGPEAPPDPGPLRTCPYCGQGLLVFTGLLRRRGRAPP